MPQVAFEPGIRLTDRGLLLAMSVAAVIVVAAVLCIVTTALRVTAEPVAGVASVTATR